MPNNPSIKPWLPLSNPPRVAMAVILSLLAIGLNYWRFPLFFGVDFIFGSIVAVMALCLLGSRAAIIVGFSAAAVTLWLWGHPYAWLLFTAEIIWLSWRWRAKPGFHLVVQDLVFWSVIALPYTLLVFTQLLNTDLAAATLIWLKQLANGVFNTLVASVVLMLLQMHKGVSKKLTLPKVKLQQLLFHTLMFLTLTAGAVPLVMDARKLEQVYQQELQQRLQLAADLSLGHLKQSGGESAVTVDSDHFSTMAAASGVALLLRDADGKLLSHFGMPDSLTSLEPIPVESGFYQIRPAQKEIRINMWLQSWYALVTPITLNHSQGSLVIAAPGRELANRLKRDSTQQLLLLVSFMLLTIAVSWWLSRKLAKPLSQIARSSSRMLVDIAKGEQTVFASQQVTEYSELAESLTTLGAELQLKFSDNEQIRQQLAEQVKQRTAELEHSNSQLEAILSAATNFSIIATDLQGVISYFSPGAEQLLGYQASELVGKQTPALIHLPAEVAARAAELTKQLKRPIAGFATFVTYAELEGSETREWHYVTKHNQHIPVALTVTCIKNNTGQITGYLGIAKDISERQRNEKLKNEFISTVSHELRTPLTSIHGALKLLASGSLLVMPPKIENMVQVACKNSERLTSLINDLLDIEKLLAGKVALELRPYLLQSLITEALDAITEYANKFGVILIAELDEEAVYCELDQQRFIQVLTNLISNAVKFSNALAEVKIKLSLQQESVYIEVIDQGVGIAEDFKDRVFERFAQSDAANTRKQGGTGLGLAISKELVQQMAGQIGFHSEAGVGTTFWLRFPLYSPEAVAVAATNVDLT